MKYLRKTKTCNMTKRFIVHSFTWYQCKKGGEHVLALYFLLLCWILNIKHSKHIYTLFNALIWTFLKNFNETSRSNDLVLPSVPLSSLASSSLHLSVLSSFSCIFSSLHVLFFFGPNLAARPLHSLGPEQLVAGSPPHLGFSPEDRPALWSFAAGFEATPSVE